MEDTCRRFLHIISIVFVYTIAIFTGSGDGLKIVGVSIPALADLRQPATLSCTYDTENDALFSVKWYKDDREFYRFMPTHQPVVMTFPLPGVNLEPFDKGSSGCGRSRCIITLSQLTPIASGSYTCEVSTEAPTFRTAIETRNMTVMALPLEEPTIEGLKAAYTIGDVLDVTCKSAPSAPAAHLTLFINNEEVSQKEIIRGEEPADEDLSISSARLKIVLSRRHLKGGGGAAVLRVRCLAALAAPAQPRTADKVATIAAPQPLHNQKLEWPSASGTKAIGTSLLLFFSSWMLSVFR